MAGAYQGPSYVPVTLTKFPSPSVITDIAYLSPNDLLVALAYPGEIHLLPTTTVFDPSDKPAARQPATRLLHSFTGCICEAIAVLDKRSFVVATSHIHDATTPQLRRKPGTGALWLVQATPGGTRATEEPRGLSIEELLDIPDAQWLKHMTTLPKQDDAPNDRPILLVTDTTAGVILVINLDTKKVEAKVVHETMLPAPNASEKIGINGIAYHDNYVYYTNTYAQTIYRIEVNPSHYVYITDRAPDPLIRKPHRFPQIGNLVLTTAPRSTLSRTYCPSIRSRPHIYAASSGLVVTVGCKNWSSEEQWKWSKLYTMFDTLTFTGGTSIAFGEGNVGNPQRCNYPAKPGPKLWVATRDYEGVARVIRLDVTTGGREARVAGDEKRPRYMKQMKVKHRRAR
ncbi:hypothetical protein BDV96DRAFT_641376 [Lophiotrema nucula]|uniref:Uncharacterized protein n=1 Tax=Lophiotrema nucula TaxID=690887 RepID=A0A6A5ZPA4_9PLEO|nr:hypothetical protein BDV96DRAFT_641376 [Lophiotrema nucula]